MSEKTYTTHDIAEFCDVYPSSVLHWIKAGKLVTQRTEGGHHRVTRENVIDFLQRLSIRLPDELVARKRVLIVEDDAEQAKLFSRAFSRKGAYEVETCGDGITALIRIGQAPPDLVILDIVIPKLDGLQVCRVLKGQPQTKGIKIIAVSGQKLPFSAKKLAELKVDGFFRKPLVYKDLMARASQLLLGEPAPGEAERAGR
ncbi:MAG: response regulator [Elusimicrobia bacterium]|nr:response regulator [Elusimicrobiota bacterium]